MGHLEWNLECHHGAGGSWGRGGIGRRTRLKIVWDENPVGVQVPPPPPPNVIKPVSSWAFQITLINFDNMRVFRSCQLR